MTATSYFVWLKPRDKVLVFALFYTTIFYHLMCSVLYHTFFVYYSKKIVYDSGCVVTNLNNVMLNGRNLISISVND